MLRPGGRGEKVMTQRFPAMAFLAFSVLFMALPSESRATTLEDLYDLVVTVPMGKLQLDDKDGLAVKESATAMTRNLTHGNSEGTFCMPDVAGLKIIWPNRLDRSFDDLMVLVTHRAGDQALRDTVLFDLKDKLARAGEEQLHAPERLLPTEDRIVVQILGSYKPIYDLSAMERLLSQPNETRFLGIARLLKELDGLTDKDLKEPKAPEPFQRGFELITGQPFSTDRLIEWQRESDIAPADGTVNRSSVKKLGHRLRAGQPGILFNDLVRLDAKPVTLGTLLGVQPPPPLSKQLREEIAARTELEEHQLKDYNYYRAYEILILRQEEFRFERRGRRYGYDDLVDYRATLSYAVPASVPKSLARSTLRPTAVRFNPDTKKYEDYAVASELSTLPSPPGGSGCSWFDLKIDLGAVLHQKIQVGVVYPMDGGNEYLVLKSPLNVHELGWQLQAPVINDIVGLATSVPKAAKEASSKYSFAVIRDDDDVRLGFMLPVVVGYNPQGAPNLSDYFNVFAHVTAYSEDDEVRFLFGGGATVVEFVQFAVGVGPGGKAHFVLGIAPHDLWKLFEQ